MDTFYQELIDEHLKPDRPESLNGDLIDVMLKNKGSFLTMDSIKAILLNVFNGGIATTGSALVFAMTALLRNQRVMKKAQEEFLSCSFLFTILCHACLNIKRGRGRETWRVVPEQHAIKLSGYKRSLTREVANGEEVMECSRSEDQEDGDNSRKKLRLSKDQADILEESFKEHTTLNPVRIDV
ncbi:hypothetical protein POM88_019615 [Heracleum sosnowskyi]|uniref:Uncharacterized protein n=1 Tax=Heracleum sosnowskyi TaxID=360622 RepID=A0AAD8IDC0_9APIA|nr:hypothetical protein POM88_019615 [Heracleum sosnowskyi]